MAMTNLETYAKRYRHLAMERNDGILQATLHSDGDELQWSAGVHEELSYAFYDIARDPQNRCVILTGKGSEFCARMDTGGGPAGLQVGKESPKPAGVGIPPTAWDHIYNDAKYLLMNLLNIE